MRAPKRRRPKRREIGVPPNIDLDSLAATVRYVGSPEHKDFLSFVGTPRMRGDASLCPRGIDQETATAWLRSAIRRGATSVYEEGGFPRHAWYRVGDIVFEARLVNRGDGSYKGYPLKDDEWPTGIESIYG